MRNLETIPSLNGIRAIRVCSLYCVIRASVQSYPAGLGVAIFFLIGYLITALILTESEGLRQS
jgi:hypothetical protein